MKLSHAILTAALVAVLLLGWAVLRQPGEPPTPAVVVPAPAELLARVSHAAPSSLPMEATTQAEVREVVHFCRAAGLDAIDELRRAALHSPDALVAGNAVRALGRLGVVADDEQLVALLDDPRPRVRQELVLALGSPGATSAVALLTPLLQGSDLEVRPLVVRSLARIGGPEARLALEAVEADPTCTEVERLLVRESLLDTPSQRPADDAR